MIAQPGMRAGEALGRLDRFTDSLMAAYAAAGARRADPPALQPAALLLDLYGEDIRNRAYLVTDPDLGEMVLRPDFTLPVLRMHLAAGGGTARYAYRGPVWRARAPGSDRPVEHRQAGIELFGGAAAATDAELFALISRLMAGAPTRVATGDMGVLVDAVTGLETAAHRRSALMRHLWRPDRFRRLLHLFGAGHAQARALRAPLLDAVADRGAQALIGTAGPVIGLRAEGDVTAALDRLAVEAQTPPLHHDQVAGLEALLAVDAPLPQARDALAALAGRVAGILPALDRIDARIEALEGQGVCTRTLPFATSFGRSSMEYYDGFVFGFADPAHPDLPAIATGGRYDGLAARLGGGPIAAIGAVIRPEPLLALRERS
ncbi:MAG: ATP phosphoribosyltransferase regulatory subunit [Pseudomonadota bacterium]